MVRVFLLLEPPAVVTAVQKQVAALWPNRAAHPAVAAMLRAHCLSLLVNIAAIF